MLVRRSVLDSDESIVGILAHEAYELRALERELAGDGTISRADLARRINDRAHGGTPVNLHERAWDECYEAVRRLRELESAR